MLNYQFIPAQPILDNGKSKNRPQRPILVFLHGLLGNQNDWLECRTCLSQFASISIDLHGHGKSHGILCTGFEQALTDIVTTLKSALSSLKQPDSPLVMVGYSLGGRLAMYGAAHNFFSCLNMQGLVIEGGNVGLTSELLRQQRLVNDTEWANRFRNEPIECVLSDWYSQTVFSSLNDVQRAALVIKRSQNNAGAVANMLLATSLAKQPWLTECLKSSSLPMHYVCGAQDRKFVALAQQTGFVFSQVAKAGHNVHAEQPQAMANIIQRAVALF